MQPAQRLATLTESVIRDMTRLALQHEAINLSQGFPDFDPPQPVVEAAAQALREGHNQYTITWGIPPLRAEIAKKYNKWYGMEVDPDTQITVTCGVSEAIIAALMATVNPGDGVIIIDPSHDNYLPGVTFAGGQPIWVSLRPPTFDLDEAELRAAFAQKPRAILLNTPQNPSGRVLSREQLQVIADLCIEHETIAITDEIYEHILYDGREHIPLATLPGMAERTVTISSAGKTFSVTGWKIGWAIAAPDLSRAIFRAHQFMTFCSAAPLQEGVAVALEASPGYYIEVAQMYQANRNFLAEALDGAGLTPILPAGTYFMMVDISRLDFPDDRAFCHYLTTEVGVTAIPPSVFYHDPADGVGLARFAFCKTRETLAAAARRLKRLKY